MSSAKKETTLATHFKTLKEFELGRLRLQRDPPAPLLLFKTELRSEKKKEVIEEKELSLYFADGHLTKVVFDAQANKCSVLSESRWLSSN